MPRGAGKRPKRRLYRMCECRAAQVLHRDVRMPRGRMDAPERRSAPSGEAPGAAAAPDVRMHGCAGAVTRQGGGRLACRPSRNTRSVENRQGLDEWERALTLTLSL